MNRIPFVASEPSGALFADWTPARWYGARARWLAERGDTVRAAATVRAMRDVLPAEAAAVEAVLAEGARRASSQQAYDEGARLMSQGLKSEARAAFERAVSIDPSNGQAWVVLSERRRVDGDLAGSAEAITHARRSDDIQVRSDAEAMVGLMALAKQDPAGALKAFAEAERILPSSPRPYLFEAQVHAQAGDVPAAIAALRRGLAAAPGSPELAAALVKLGQVP
jgi:Tfp pilus assembly protein PilF